MYKFYIKRLTAALAVILCAALLAGCGQAASLKRPEATEGATEVTISGTCSISQEGDVFTVSGSIDVMNGTWIDVSVVSQNGMILAHKTFQRSDEPILETFTITADKLEGVVDVKGYICCAPSYYHKQETEVYNVYGKKFENIQNGADTAVFNNEGVVLTFASDWLHGAIPSPTAGPTPTPAETADTSPSAETSPSA